MTISRSWVSVRFVLLLIMILVGFFSARAGIAQVNGKVRAVVDGNTLLVVLEDGDEFTLILDGIDSPELEQDYGLQAKDFLEKKAVGKQVKIELRGKDRWGNRLAVVWLKGEVDLRAELLKAGYAWTAERNPDETLENLRLEAQQKGKGLWQSASATAPWIYRRQQSMMQAKGS